MAFETARTRALLVRRAPLARALPLARSASSCARSIAGGDAHPRRDRARATATSSAAGRCCARATGRCVALRARCAASRDRVQSRMTPDEYCQQKAAQAARASTTASCFLPPQRRARDHRALRVLPRSRRRRRRGDRSPTSRARSSRGGATRSTRSSPARRSIRWRGRSARRARVTACRRRICRRSSTAWQMDLEQHALPRLRRARALLPSRRRRRRPAVGGDLRLRGPAHARLRARPRHRVPAHQHHPRRRRGRAPRTASTCRRTTSRASASRRRTCCARERLAGIRAR